MSDDEYLSDHASDVESYDDEEVEEIMTTPADPVEGFDEDEELDDEIEELDDPEHETEETGLDDDLSVDLKSVSKYNKEIIVVKPENRITGHVLTLYNMTEIISIRSTQIAQHNNCMVDITGLTDPIKMAKRELMMRKCPLILRRVIGDIKDPKTGEPQTYVEFWDVNTMQFATEYMDV